MTGIILTIVIALFLFGFIVFTYFFLETSVELTVFEKLREYIDRSDAEYAEMQAKQLEMIDKIDTLKENNDEDSI